MGVTICPKPLPRVVVQACHPVLPCHPEAKPKDLDSSVVSLPQNDTTNEIAASQLVVRQAHHERGVSILVLDDDPVIRHPEAKPKDLDSSVVSLPQNDTTNEITASQLVVRQAHHERGVSILVLDDDPVIRQTWKMQCKMWDIATLYTCASMEECVRSNVDLSKVDLAFVDKNIDGSAWATDALIAHLKTNGVRKVWISSGEALQDLENDFACAAADGIVEGKIPLEIEPYTKGMNHDRHAC